MVLLRWTAAAGALWIAGCAAQGPSGERPDGPEALAKATEAIAAAGTCSPTTSSGFTYSCGSLMTGPIHFYYIWYGSFTDAQKQPFIDFANDVGGSDWFRILATWPDGSGATIRGPVSYAGATTDNLSHGTDVGLSGAVEAVVSNAITSGALPSDPNGFYVMLGDPTVSNSTCDCAGYHQSMSVTTNGQATDIRYSWVQWQGAADDMLPLSHEFAEAATDSDPGSGWTNGGEIGDACEIIRPPGYTDPAGDLANLHVAGRDYLVQEIWTNVDGGQCLAAYFPDVGATCASGTDCPYTHACTAGVCSAPTCTDGVQNGNEYGVDCGPSCSLPCHCKDGVQDGGESDVDCGGECASCALGRTCGSPFDCEQSAYCVAGVCTTQSVTITTQGGITTASGQLGTARASTDPFQEIGCWITVSQGAAGLLAACAARDVKGTLVSCSSSSPYMVQAVRAITSDSFVTFQEQSAECTAVTIGTTSALLPVTP